MALISTSNYKPPFWLLNGHVETFYPAVFRNIKAPVAPEKRIINTPDKDFFELDYYNNDANKTVIISHGLEGNNQRPYVIGMTKLFYQKGWNVAAWNYRGCNGLVNNTIKSYHSGFTEDLEEVIKFVLVGDVKKIVLVGFSLGGNITLKYLGEPERVNKHIVSAVTFSVPVDLYHGCMEISKPANIFYSKRFLRTLKHKIREKSSRFPEIPTKPLQKINDLKTFDDYYTAPLHGFRDAMDYYQSCSSINVLERIETPALIVNAINDPFLPKECYPYKLLKNHRNVFLETPRRGGHVGFCSLDGSEFYWSEHRAYEFISKMI